MNPELYILGSGSATPTRERNPSAQLLKIGSAKILIDCGEGTQMQLLKYGVRHTGVDYICISHLHGDHYFGLIGLISTMSLMGRQQLLNIIGPPGLKDILDLQILHGGMSLKFDLNFIPTNGNHPEHILSNDDFELSSFPLKHRIHCTGFLIKEAPKQRRLLPEIAASHNIPVEAYKSIKAGSDYINEAGEVISNDILTEAAGSPRSYAYCSDTIFDKQIASYFKDVNLLYHESTYMKNLEDRANMYFHSTAEQAATIASMTNAGQLIIGHFSSRYDNLQPLLDEAREVFTNTELAVEGSVWWV
ncbi:MAG: ribonuclease Z [Chitinophagaceae bacterium]